MTSRGSRKSLTLRIALAIIGALIIVVLLMYIAHGLSAADWTPFGETPAKKTDWRNVAWIATPAATLVVAVVAAVIAVDQQQTRRTELENAATSLQQNATGLEHTATGLQQAADNAARAHQLADISTLRDRYTKAAEQLGSPSSAIRLAGVYAMAALADDWAERDRRDETQTCVNVLCAYLRTPRQPTAATSADQTPEERERHQQSAHIAETTVRQTITDTITAHLQPTAKRHWRGLSIDLKRAHFDFNASFDGAVFSGGRVSFVEAEFSGGRVSFVGAEFSGGWVSFDGAEFSGGWVSFVGAEFSGGSVSFDLAGFSEGRVVFDRARLSGGRVSFERAEFSGALVSFFGAGFSDNGRVSFTGAKFSDGWVSFDRARFSDGSRVSFTGAGFSGGWVSFDGAEFSGPSWLAFKEAWGSTEPGGADPTEEEPGSA